MIFNIGRVRVDLSPLFFIFCALLILVDKTGMMSASIIASLIHEFSHIFSMNMVKCPPRNIKIRAYGMEIVGGICNSFLSNSIITLSGPFSNIILALISIILYQKYATYFLLSFYHILSANGEIYSKYLHFFIPLSIIYGKIEQNVINIRKA